MIEVLKFILQQVINFLKMLFTIDVGNSINLGTMMCVCFIFLPLALTFFNFLKGIVVEELDEKYDSSRRSKDNFRTYIGKHEKYKGYRGKHEATYDELYRPRHIFKGKHGR